MECPVCGFELEWKDSFFRYPECKNIGDIGDIYICKNGGEQDGSCDSEFFHVAGCFYTFREGDASIHEGYPC